jgi:hypothetical protein
MPVGLDCDTMSLGMLAPGFEQHEGQIISSVSNVTHWCVSCASGPLPMKGSRARTPTNVISLRTLASAFFIVPSSPFHTALPASTPTRLDLLSRRWPIIARVSGEKSISVHISKLTGMVWIGNAETVQVIPAHPIREEKPNSSDSNPRDLREGQRLFNARLDCSQQCE